MRSSFSQRSLFFLKGKAAEFTQDRLSLKNVDVEKMELKE